MRKISAANTEACPECGAEAFSKQLSAPSFQLNGSGWYATDFKNGSGSSPAKAASKSSSSAESKSEKKSDEVAAPAACGTGCACH